MAADGMAADGMAADGMAVDGMAADGVAADPLVVVLGVSGAGKTTIGTALAERLGVPFLDADSLHPPENIAKMRVGTALDDDDRWPWLDLAGSWLAEHDEVGGVLACSALKRSYRDRLRDRAPRVVMIELTAARAVLAARVAARSHPFMPGSLLGSQLATLEPLAPDEAGLVVDASRPAGVVVEQAVGRLAGTAT